MILEGDRLDPPWSRGDIGLFYFTPEPTLRMVDLNSRDDFETGSPMVLSPPGIQGNPNSMVRFVVSEGGRRFPMNTPAVLNTANPVTVAPDWAGALEHR